MWSFVRGEDLSLRVVVTAEPTPESDTYETTTAICRFPAAAPPPDLRPDHRGIERYVWRRSKRTWVSPESPGRATCVSCSSRIASLPVLSKVLKGWKTVLKWPTFARCLSKRF